MAGDYTVGVEEEYQLVDPETGQLRSAAAGVLETDWTSELKRELQQTMVEVGTPVCDSTEGVRTELRRLRFQVASAAAAEGLAIVAAGIHPFSAWQGQNATPGERYDAIRERFGRVVRTKHIFGMHVHVAVPEGVDRARIAAAVRPHTPVLLALAASSPIYEGEDTGYASYRSILYSRLPHAGPPPRFESEAEERAFVDLLLRSGALQDRHTIYWTIRSHPDYPTLEFRGTDACPRVEDAVAIATLCRAMVAAAVDGALTPPDLLGCDAEYARVSSNAWQAARYGLAAGLTDPSVPGGALPLRDAARRLLDAVAPAAEALGDDVASGIERIFSRGNAADRIRAADVAGEPRELVEWLTGESLLGTGMDRREEQRAGSG